ATSASYTLSLHDALPISIELVEQEHWQVIKDHGLAIASLKGQSSIEEGFNRREHHDHLEREVRANIALAAQWGIPNVIVTDLSRSEEHTSELQSRREHVC